MNRRRVEKCRQRHPLFARDDTLFQSDKHDEPIRSIEPQKDRSMTIQQARAVKIRHDGLVLEFGDCDGMPPASNSSDRFRRALTNLKSCIAFLSTTLAHPSSCCAKAYVREMAAIGTCGAPRPAAAICAISRGDTLKRQATMSQLEIIVQIETALANAKNCALALVDIAETLEGDRRFIVQQIAWSIQNELDTASQCLRNQKNRAPAADSSSDSSAVVRLTSRATREPKSDT